MKKEKESVYGGKNYTYAAMYFIRKSNKFDIVSSKQIDALADYIKHRDLTNTLKGITMLDMINVVRNAK